MERRKTSLLAMVTTLLLGGTALALWLGGWNITGHMSVSGGSPAAAQESVITFPGASGNITANATYQNTDGIQEFGFSCSDSAVTSTAANCVYQGLGKDIKAIYLSEDGSTWRECSGNPVFQFEPGANTMYFMVDIHENGCPLGGHLNITAALQ